MTFIKNFIVYAVIAAIVLALRLGLVALVSNLEQKVNKKYEQLQETPTGSLLLLYIVFYFSNILNTALISIPVLFIFSSWHKVFSVILCIVVFIAIVYSLYALHAVYNEYSIKFKKAKASIIISSFINQITSNLFIVLGTSAISTAFDISDNAVSYIHDIAWTIAFIINIVIIVKACKANSKMLKEFKNTSEIDENNYDTYLK